MRRRTVSAVAALLVAVVCAGRSRTGDTAAGASSARRPRVTVALPASSETDSPDRVDRSWSTPIQGRPTALASDAAGVVATVDGRAVAALDRSGHASWRAAVAGAAGSPWLGAGVVVVPTTPTAGAGGCVALDRESGARRWSYEERGGRGVAVAGAGGNVLCAFGDGVIVAIDITTGERHWRTAIAANLPRSSVNIASGTSLAVDESRGYFAVTTRLDTRWFVAVRYLKSGGEWSAARYASASPSAPVALGHSLLAVGGSDPGAVCFIDLKGAAMRVLGCVVLPAANGFDPASIPVAAGDALVFGARNGWMTGFDLRHTRVRWEFRLATTLVDSRPEVSRGAVLIADRNGVAWVLTTTDGSPIEGPDVAGSVVATAADASGGFDLAIDNHDVNRIEHWEPASD